MTYTEQLRRLLESLFIRTMEKDISWTYDEASDSCEASLGDGFVEVSGETDEDGDYLTLVKILNERKQVIDRIYGGSYGLSDFNPHNTTHKNYWSLIKELKTAAERSALGADRVIDSILVRLASGNLPLTDSDDVPF